MSVDSSTSSTSDSEDMSSFSGVVSAPKVPVSLFTGSVEMKLSVPQSSTEFLLLDCSEDSILNLDRASSNAFVNRTALTKKLE